MSPKIQDGESSRPSRLLSVKEVAARCGVSVRTVWRWVNRPGSGFPQPVKEVGGGRCTRWRESEIEAFCSQGVAA